jgi:dTDP-4-amino-4,6-dideoxygalactose transaminase
MNVAMVDLQRQRQALEPGLSAAMTRVLDHGGFVAGPEVGQLEKALSLRLGGVQTVACANGTDAITVLLRAAGIGPGDAVIVPSLTFVSTAEAVLLAGATPILTDVEAATGTLCPDNVLHALSDLPPGLRARAILAVDLFSLPCDYRRLAAIAAAQGLHFFVDAAHSIGTQTPDGPCGTLAAASTTSFYPTKALGCYGDGGAVFLRDAGLATETRAVANHGVISGAATGHARIGTNSRLDTLQAALLLEKLAAFEAETARRRVIAQHYRSELAGHCTLPEVAPGVQPVWSYFMIRHPDRDAWQAHLAQRGVGSVAYYRVPTHLHPAYADLPQAPGGLPETLAHGATLLCLPIHPYLTEAEVSEVVAAVVSFGVSRGGLRVASAASR